MTRDDVASTLIRRHFGTKYPLGCHDELELTGALTITPMVCFSNAVM